MATSFNNKYTELTDINYGNQLQNGDDILAEHTNSALQNTAHLKTLLNNSVVRSVSVVNNKLVLTLATKGNNDSSATIQTLELDVSDIGAVPIQVINSSKNATITNHGDYVSIEVFYAYGDEDNTEYSITFNISHNDIIVSYRYSDDISGETISNVSFARVLTYVNIKVSSAHQSSNFDGDFNIIVNKKISQDISSMAGVRNSCPANGKIMASGWLKRGSNRYQVEAIKFESGNDFRVYYLDSNNAEESYLYNQNYFDVEARYKAE